MEVQKQIYDSVFEKWKGNKEQTDDVLFIGLKPPFEKRQTTNIIYRMSK